MKEKVFTAIQLLEYAQESCFERSMSREVECLQFGIEALSSLANTHFSEHLSSDLSPLAGLEARNPALELMRSYLKPEAIKMRFPNLEDAAIDIAIKKIAMIQIDTSEFEKKVDQIFIDVNDEIILQLLGF